MRSTVITVCIFFFSPLLLSGGAQALDVNKACNGDFNRCCSRYDWVGRWGCEYGPSFRTVPSPSRLGLGRELINARPLAR
jgi:hypothetical protein